MDQCLKASELADRLGVSIPTLCRWRGRGLLPEPLPSPTRRLRWRLADIERWERDGFRRVTAMHKRQIDDLPCLDDAVADLPDVESAVAELHTPRLQAVAARLAVIEREIVEVQSKLTALERAREPVE